MTARRYGAPAIDAAQARTLKSPPTSTRPRRFYGTSHESVDDTAALYAVASAQSVTEH